MLHWLCICLPSSAAPTPQSAEPHPQCTVHGAGGCHRGQDCQQSCGLQRTVMQGGYATTHLVPTYVYTHHTHINTDTYIPLHTSIQAQYTCAVIMTLLGPSHTHIRTYVRTCGAESTTLLYKPLQWLIAPAEVTET